MSVDYGADAIESRLRRSSEMRSLGISLRRAVAPLDRDAILFRSIVRALASGFGRVARDGDTRAWTSAVVQSLLSLRGAMAELTALAPSTLGAFHRSISSAPRSFELGVDFAWGTWTPHAIQDPTLGPTQPPWEILLAAESEWGSRASAPENQRRVLFDLRKLLDVRARYRVMVYAGHLQKRPDFDDLEAAMLRLIDASAHRDADAPLLLVGVPWDAGADLLRAWCTRLRAGRTERVDLRRP